MCLLFDVSTCTLSCRKADKVLKVVSEDKSQRRKHKLAYGEHCCWGYNTLDLLNISWVTSEFIGPAYDG